VELTDAKFPKDFREGCGKRLRPALHDRAGSRSDGYHEDHVHVDLAERRGGYRICEWVREPLASPSGASRGRGGPGPSDTVPLPSARRPITGPPEPPSEDNRDGRAASGQYDGAQIEAWFMRPLPALSPSVRSRLSSIPTPISRTWREERSRLVL